METQNRAEATHYADNMRTATIGDNTRSLLIALGKLDDLFEDVSRWAYDTFNDNQADEIVGEAVGDGFSSLSTGLYNLLAQSIEAARCDADCTEI